jgi:uracil-DNA glycosylase family 4
VTPEERRQALDEIATEVRACTRCRLHQGRTNAVPGEGHPETEVVFVGEGPGFNEDQQGRPFVGAAGGLLQELLASIGWRREEVFITNVVKCRPPGNRDPEPDEIAACRPYLERQLQALDPAVVVSLGRFSLNSFMPGARISSAHGTARPLDPTVGAPDATAYALYHPAAAFRQASLRETLFRDMANIPELLISARGRRAGQPRADTSAVEPTPQPRADTSAVEPTPQAPEPTSQAPERTAPAVPASIADPGRSGLQAEPSEDDQMRLF